jgi:multicomponent Na+:H+ antiporter subunit D
MNELPLLVALPVAGAVVALALGGRRRLAAGVVTVTLLAHLGLALALSARAVGLAGGGATHVVGGFTAPYGIELGLDGVSALVVVLVPSAVLLVRAATRVTRPASVGALSLLLVAGLAGVALARDVFTLYVFLEITGIAAYALVAVTGDGRAAVAALRYLLVGTVGATLYLLGVGYLYVATGTLNAADLAGRLPPLYESPLVLAAFALVAVGLGVKVALFPLHAWQPAVYDESPDDVSAVLAGLVSTVAAYALFRLVADVFTPAFLVSAPTVRSLALAAALGSVVAGSVLAVRQARVKRMLAYSSVAQFGLVVSAFLLLSETAAFGGVVHLLGHAVVKVGLFVAAGAIAARTGARTVEEYTGVAARSPVHAALFGVLALALVGVPPTVGFAGKWFIALGAVETGSWGVLAVVLASTLLTLAYVVRLIERMYSPVDESFAVARSTSSSPGGAAATDGGAAGAPATGRPGGLPFGDARVALAATAAAAVGLGLAVGFLEPLATPALGAFASVGVGP